MSIPENVGILMKVFKPKITRFKPGDLVVDKADKSRKLLVVTQIWPDGTYPDKSADYGTVSLSERGKAIYHDFKQKQLEFAEK